MYTHHTVSHEHSIRSHVNECGHSYLNVWYYQQKSKNLLLPHLFYFQSRRSSWTPKTQFNDHTHLVHLHACAEVGEFEVATAVQQHVFRFDVSVDEAHGVDGIQCQHHFSCVEACPFLRHVVIHGEGYQISTCHELHHQVEMALILKCTAQLCKHRETKDNYYTDTVNI